MNDTEKLSLIKEHASEYYKNSRRYVFIESGYIQFETSYIGDKFTMYITELFISKGRRGGTTLKALTDHFRTLIDFLDVEVTYARTEKENPSFIPMSKMYQREGFVEYGEDQDALYFKRITP